MSEAARPSREPAPLRPRPVTEPERSPAPATHAEGEPGHRTSANHPDGVHPTFTPGLVTPTRYLTPDLARGFMLVLISLANVAWWTTGANVPTSELDRWWLLTRTALIDHRAYPLFACLFGYGFATIVRRRLSHDPSVSAMADTRRMLRRRGWWMVAFGLVHATLFPGDILGNYGLAAVILASMVAPWRPKTLWALASISTVICLAAATWDPGDDTSTLTGEQIYDLIPSVPWPLSAWAVWVLGTVAMIVTSLLVLAIHVGVWLGRTDILNHPERHRRLLLVALLSGFTVGVAGSMPIALGYVGLVPAQYPPWASVLNMATSVFAAAGWLAAIALVASYLGNDRASTLRWWHPVRFLVATGKRSLTAYVAQTVLFSLLYEALDPPGVSNYGPAVHAAISVGLWWLIGVGCLALDIADKQGPGEWLLRTLVGRGKRRA